MLVISGSIRAWSRLPRRWRGGILTAVILVALLPLANKAPAFWRLVFCMPAALISAGFMGVDAVQTGEGIMLAHPVLSVHVTPECSAGAFFILIAALSLGILYRYKRLSPMIALFVVALCYGIAVVANTTRIVLGWYAGAAARATLPENFWYAIHTGVGVFVFLIFLVTTHWFIHWRMRHARQPRPT